MLAIFITNDGTGKDGVANYNYKVKVTENGDDGPTYRTIREGRIEGHRRLDGWECLAKKVANNSLQMSWMQAFKDMEEEIRERQTGKSRVYPPTEEVFF